MVTQMELKIYVQPGGKKSEILGEHGDAIKIRIAAPPVEGAANEELIRFLAEHYGVKRRDVEIVSGHTSRNKRVRITKA
jgi:uncharacterized protein (TIGR00251 family)